MTKKDRRVVKQCIADAQIAIDKVERWPIGDSRLKHLEEVYRLLTLIALRLEGKRGKRRHDRGV